MTMPEVIAFLERYASAVDAPVHAHHVVDRLLMADRAAEAYAHDDRI